MNVSNASAQLEPRKQRTLEEELDDRPVAACAGHMEWCHPLPVPINAGQVIIE
jgi:hypothetical protein